MSASYNASIAWKFHLQHYSDVITMFQSLVFPCSNPTLKPTSCHDANFVITVTSWWTRWRLRSSASRLFVNHQFRHDQRKHQSSAPLSCVREIHRWPVDSPHKGPVTQKMWRRSWHPDFSGISMQRSVSWWPISMSAALIQSKSPGRLISRNFPKHLSRWCPLNGYPRDLR